MTGSEVTAMEMHTWMDGLHHGKYLCEGQSLLYIVMSKVISYQTRGTSFTAWHDNSLHCNLSQAMYVKLLSVVYLG